MRHTPVIPAKAGIYTDHPARHGLIAPNWHKNSRMIQSLSKSKFQSGLQCLKRLYLESYHPGTCRPRRSPACKPDLTQAPTVGEVARKRFPNGRLIEESHLEHDQAVGTTQTLGLLSDSSVPALYEAAFTFQGIRTRVDVLNRNALGKFDLVEVKSSTRLKPEHITDIAIQVYAVEGSGVPIKGAYLMHLDNTYVYQGGRTRPFAPVHSRRCHSSREIIHREARSR